MDEGSPRGNREENEDMTGEYHCPDLTASSSCHGITTKSRKGVDCKGHDTVPDQGRLDPLLFEGGVAQDEIAHQPVFPTNSGGRSEGREHSLN